MKKKILLRRPVCILLIFVIVFGAYGIFLLVKGDEHTVYANYSAGYSLEKAEVVFGEDDKTESDIFEITDISTFDGYVRATVKAKTQGTEAVCLKTYARGSGTDYERVSKNDILTVGKANIILNNIYQHIYIVLSILSLLICVYYIYCFVNAVKTRRYSYDTIFFLSVVMMFAMLLAVWVSASVYSFTQYHTTSSEIIYSVNRNLMTMLIFATLPFMVVYIVSVSVSNIRLMTREGFRPANALGIITSIVMIVGLSVMTGLFYYNQAEKKIWTFVLYSVLSSLYIFFFIVLISAIVYGIYVSKHKPEYDKDYIIILGCKIRDDGTLYPLIRGRADKAIEFYNKQLEVTGKAACFVPSGGQGSDEVIAEGEAVKNYLIEQGIPEDRIFAETESTTTRENMRFSKAIIDEKTENAKILFSTTSYHVFRSGAIAYSNGIKADGVGSKTKWYFWPNAFLREVAGIFTTQPKKQILIMVLIALSAGMGSFLYSMVNM